MKLKEKLRAIKLRKAGTTYSKIRKELKVSKSTLSLWLREIELKPSQKKKILVGLEKSREVASNAKRLNRLNKTRIISIKARKDFPKLCKNPLFLTGLALYAAEGDKNSLERVKFANSDEELIILMMRWFREICLVPEERFRIALHIHNLHSSPKILNLWSKLTGIPKAQFYSLYVKQSSLGQRKNILYNGTCSIVINSRDLFRRIMAWKQMMFEHFGCL